ncbi:MAG: aldose epimerase family protein [Rhizobiaceae bacterium]
MDTEQIGTTDDGNVVERCTLVGGGLTMNLLSWGCVVQDLRLESFEKPLVLGFEKFDYYPEHSRFFGSTAGRYANRIANGRFVLDGNEYQCDQNFLGKHCLHGGSNSLGVRNWKFTEITGDSAVLEIIDPDGEMGFPGKCEIKATFSLREGGRLHIRYEAVCDAPTLVNLAHHSYFNLAGEGDIQNHEMEIEADYFLEVDEEAIPLGEPSPVEDTEFDFRKMRRIGMTKNGELVRYDHNFCAAGERRALTQIARVRSNSSNVEMVVSSTEPGVQFYDANKLETPVPGLIGKPYGSRAGFCLEPQIWPDSPNRSYYPQAVLRPGEQYVQETEYRFGMAADE